MILLAYWVMRMDNLVDIHTHILPEIDDGAETVADSIQLAKEAVAQGITRIVATPHHQNGVYNNQKEDVLSYIAALQEEFDRRKINITLLAGQEIQVYGECTRDLQEGKLLTINNSGKYLLLELPYDHVPTSIHNMIYEIQLLGVTPIIPHPERNVTLRRNPALLYRMIDRGALSQLTAASILGKFGKEVQAFSYQCIEHSISHMIASDAHRPVKRGILLREAYEHMTRRYDIDLTNEMIENVNRVVEGKNLFVDQPERPGKKKKKFFTFWKR